MTIKEALENSNLSLEDEIDYNDTPEGEEIACLRLEIERLNNIIKEVREYLDIDEDIRKTCKRYDVNGIAILEILDKGE